MSLVDRIGPLFLKTASIGLLTLLLLWPLARVESLIEERQGLEEQAQQRIVAAWGGPQWLSGPLLPSVRQKAWM